MPATPAISSGGHHNALLSLVDNLTTNATDIPGLEVICAFPLSGQYGPGTRVLYYVFVAACIFARKAEWLRNACLAAALLLPAVAALHGIVLAALPTKGAIDMDIYGAFQLCAIGILAAPVTVRLSSTYFNDPGRNAIFVWTGLLLAGLLCLTVSFFRTHTVICTDGMGNLLFPTPDEFYSNSPNVTCGLVCNVNDGPFSPLRQGSTNNIYVIPSPYRLTFGTATLLSAACCIPAILQLVSMWNKILDINWKNRFGKQEDNAAQLEEPIEGTNGATMAQMNSINSLVRKWLSAIEFVVFGAAVIAIMVIGELNFFSHPVLFQTEPIESVGQWAPIAGAGLAVLGSLYLLLASDPDEGKEETQSTSSGPPGPCHYNCSRHSIHGGATGLGVYAASVHSVAISAVSEIQMRNSFQRSGEESEVMPEMIPIVTLSTTTSLPYRQNTQKTTFTADVGGRRKVSQILTDLGNRISDNAHNDDAEFKHGKAGFYPEIPGEEGRNPTLQRTRELYNHSDVEETPRRSRSRAGSVISVASDCAVEDSPAPEASSPQFPRLTQSPTLSVTPPYASTLPYKRASLDLHTSPDLHGSRPRTRRATLEVPSSSMGHHQIPRSVPPEMSVTPPQPSQEPVTSPRMATDSNAPRASVSETQGIDAPP